jgi:hypothetical protein
MSPFFPFLVATGLRDFLEAPNNFAMKLSMICSWDGYKVWFLADATLRPRLYSGIALSGRKLPKIADFFAAECGIPKPES